MAIRLFRSLVVLAALAAVPQGWAGDPFAAPPPPGPLSAPLPLAPTSPTAEMAPYLSAHPSSAAPDFRSGPSSLDDYLYLRNGAPTPDLAFQRLLVRARPPVDGLGGNALPLRDPRFLTPLEPRPLLEPRPPLGAEPCSSAWFSPSACVLRLYTGEGRR